MPRGSRCIDMDLKLDGKFALISGGSAGIGLACARLFVSEGVSVAIASRSAERLAGARTTLEAIARERAGSTPRIVTIAADLAQAEDVERTAREATAAFGKIDILINNAGSAMGGPFLKLPDAAFLDAWTLKLLGYIRMCRAVLPPMIERRHGAIVNIVGGAARTPTPAFLTGSTGNAAIINFTRGLSKELAPHNVRINAISPGITATERAERLLEQEVTGDKTIEHAREARLQRVPLRRVTHPDEIARMAALIVSDEMPTMTGSEVVIDGGSQPGI
jgi:3-oxoacyl-[acyl-carrier protein] reductase/bacilysin biosynthesis oxidoreductase BacG